LLKGRIIVLLCKKGIKISPFCKGDSGGFSGLQYLPHPLITQIHSYSPLGKEIKISPFEKGNIGGGRNQIHPLPPLLKERKSPSNSPLEKGRIIQAPFEKGGYRGISRT